MFIKKIKPINALNFGSSNRWIITQIGFMEQSHLVNEK